MVEHQLPKLRTRVRFPSLAVRYFKTEYSKSLKRRVDGIIRQQRGLHMLRAALTDAIEDRL